MRFRWAFCQLEILRYCLPPSVRRTLDELPESLDETYERVLKEIKKPNRDHARRVLQCLVAAIRPLDVKELAEVLAVDFDDAEGIPKLKTNWRWEDEEQALLTSCSSLITIAETDDSRVVQFSHFSVKEYLTSARLATSSGDISRYYIYLEPAHTILGQACMSVLLQSGDGAEEDGVRNMSPLTEYAARHWVTHARFETVSSFLRKAMEYLFDLDRPYFAAWLQSHDIDIRPNKESSSLNLFAVVTKSSGTPLYYAALCGFEDLVEHLVVKYPEHVDTRGGYFMTPLLAALAGRHFQIAKLLYHDGTDVNVRGNDEQTPLCSAAYYGDLEMVRVLLDYKADVNLRDRYNWAPILNVSWPDVIRLLLEHGADVNMLKVDNGETPLHLAAYRGRVEVVRVLLEHGANLGAQDNQGRIPLQQAVFQEAVEVIRVLLEHGSHHVGVKDNQGRTPLHYAVAHGKVEVVRVLLEHGANIGAQDYQGTTSLHKAVVGGSVEVVHVLLEHGADVGAQDHQGTTPLHKAVVGRNVEVVRVLLEHGAEVGAQDNYGRISLHPAACWGEVEVVRMLLENGADIGAQDNQGRTPLRLSAGEGTVENVRVLLDHGADVRVRDNQGRTPLHQAAYFGRVEVVGTLLEHGADVGAQDNQGRTAFQYASANKNEVIIDLLSLWAFTVRC